MRALLARDVETAQAAADAKSEAGIRELAARGDTQGWVWRLITTYVPEVEYDITGTRYDAKVTGFAVAGKAITFGDDVLRRAANGKLADVAQELRGAATQIASVDIAAGRPAIVWIGRERVRVSSLEQKRDAERIAAALPKDFGVTLDSFATRHAAREQYSARGDLDERVRATDVAPWEYKELAAIEAALKHYAPILGDARKRSKRAKLPQEVVNVGKLTVAADDDPSKPAEHTEGQYFRDSKTYAIFNPGPDSLSLTDPKALERTATHEIAHGVFASELDDFMRMTGYWKKKLLKSGADGAEAPPDPYADTNAGEDLAQSVMYFFVDPKRLKDGDGHSPPGRWGNPCPKRFAWVKRKVEQWTG
jgi:hypothetical protein